MAQSGILHESASSGAGDPPENSCPHRNSLTQRQRGRAGFGLYLDVFCCIVHDADADVVVVEVLLNLAHDIAHHLLGVLAGDGGLRDGVQKCEMLGAALLFREQTSILDCDAKLPGSSFHHFEIARFEDVFPFRAESGHHSGGYASQHDWNSTKRLCRARRNEIDS